jgi:hypothetical protein
MPEGQGELRKKADQNDAPEYIQTGSNRSGANAWIIPGITLTYCK